MTSRMLPSSPGVWRRYSRFLIGAAVFLLCACAFFAAKSSHEARYPERQITRFRKYEHTGLKRRYNKKKGHTVFRSVEYDPHLVITSEDSISSIGFLVDGLKKNKRYPEKIMEVFYDTGNDFNEEECIRIRLRKGALRVDFDTLKDVHRVRIDFFNNTGGKLRLRSMTLNPKLGGNLWIFAAVCAISMIFILALTRKAPRLTFILGFFFWGAVNLTAGIPFLRDPNGEVLVPYLVFAGLFLFVFGAMLLPEGRRKEILFTAGLMAAAFAVYFFWASITPYAEGPDEAMRHDVVYYICEHGTLPTGYAPEVRNQIWGFSYAYYPILPYIIGGYLEYILYHTGDPSWMELVMLSRMVSIVSGVLTVFFASRLSATLFKGRPVRYLLPVFIAFFPELAFINTYVNNDSMAIMTTAMILFFWARGCEYDWRWRDAVGLSIAMGLCALTYYNCYGYILMSIPLFFLTVFLGNKSRKEIWKMTACIVLLTFAVCGWFFIRNAILYDGDLLGRKTLNYYAEIYARDGYKPSQLDNPKKNGETLRDMFFAREWLVKTLRSFVAMFSTYSLRARHYVYVIYKWFFGISFLGAAVWAVRSLLMNWSARRRQGNDLKGQGNVPQGQGNALRGQGNASQGQGNALRGQGNATGGQGDALRDAGAGSETAGKGRVWAVFWVSAALALLIVLLLAVYYSYAVDFQPQGRYILPCVLPLACFVTCGCREIAGLIAALAEKVRSGRASGENRKAAQKDPGGSAAADVRGGGTVLMAETVITGFLSVLLACVMLLILLDTVFKFYV